MSRSLELAALPDSMRQLHLRDDDRWGETRMAFGVLRAETSREGGIYVPADTAMMRGPGVHAVRCTQGRGLREPRPALYRPVVDNHGLDGNES